MRFRSTLSAARPLPAIVLALVLLGGCSDDDSGPTPPGEPTLTAIEVAPATSTVEAGGTVAFTATGRMSDNTTTAVTVTWAATGGTIAATGNYTAGSVAGAYQVSATSGSITGTAAVTVTAVPPVDINLGLVFLTNDFVFPTFLTSPPGDPRLFIVERAGRIRIYKAGAVVATPFLDITTMVKSDEGEQGFVGLAFDPSYSTNGRFFVSYVALDGSSVLASYTVSGNADVANAGSRVERLVVPHPATAYHYSGGIQFGADGYLYMALGDGGESTDPNGRGQSLADLLGNIIRIDVSGAAGYAIPASNPFEGMAGDRGEVWSYGLRNPWRFSFDRATGDLYIGDVGQDTREEINASPALTGAGRGTNYGWAIMEGSTCYLASSCNQTGLTLPVVEYDHDPRCSVTGGYVYRGAAIPALQGTYFYSDFCVSVTRSFRLVGGVATDQREWSTLAPASNVVSFGEDAAGELYLVTRSAGIYRVVSQ